MDKLTVGAGCEKEQKHINISKALASLGHAISDAESVICRIRGEDQPKGPTVDSQEQRPSLLEFMDTSSEMVDTYRERILEIVNQLNQTIF